VEKPARYSGGEYGRLAAREAALKTIIAFPDLYEIGMSNQALRIIYNRLNRMEDISCDRSFAPAPDFEKLLKQMKLPLYGLDTGISLRDADLLMFTLGYELGITGVFTMLEISGIPLLSRNRGDSDPLVIMGGPCVSNPLPYSVHIDAFWIGEAEGGFFELAGRLAAIKKAGGKRNDLLECLLGHRSVWARGKGGAVRALDLNFSEGMHEAAVFPVPGMKVVQNHGAVEIMRGCLNGCRFCHAGYWYRPMRQKDAGKVEAETEAFISKGGYREITLSSLSSGDYRYLDRLMESLNDKYKKRRISFQLPSLKVSGFSLNLLEKISEVRKSGLTFAVETPADYWQMAINKRVSGEDVVSILREAKRRGWKSAKFYFMIGLPLDKNSKELKTEEEEIEAFIKKTAALTGMRFTITIGTFIPKSNTPFQWAAQINREESERKLSFLRVRLKSMGHKAGIQDPLISVIEGILSRGDERAGELFEEAFHLGCRLDSWSEYLQRNIWESILKKYRSLVDEILDEKSMGHPLPWSRIQSGVSENYLKNEFKKAQTGEITFQCINNCTKPCGICSDVAKIVENTIQDKAISHNNMSASFGKKDPDTHRIIFSFSKQGSAVFHSHLGLLEIFSMAFVRASIPVLYSQGFNPLPRLDIASPLSLGITASGEIAAIDTEVFFDAGQFRSAFNSFLPEGFEVKEAMNVYIPSGEKKHSVSSLLWGFVYSGEKKDHQMVKAKEEKAYREARIEKDGSIFSLERLSVLARPAGNSGEPGASYFEVFRELYPFGARLGLSISKPYPCLPSLSEPRLQRPFP
jgi:radical SAM superfamily enzyme YgiQ (UPF0313 family)